MPTPFPETFPHPYGAVAFSLVLEVPYVRLVYLHQLMTANGRRVPSALTDALRKSTWAKSAAIELMAISDYVDELVADPQVLSEDLVARVRFERSMVDFAAHLKAATDALSIFAEEAWHLGVKQASEQDFKKNSFREKFVSVEPRGRAVFDKYKIWLMAGSQSYENLACLRDELIHRSSFRSVVHFPPTELGALPIPRAPKYRASKVAERSHLSVAQFTNHHMNNLFGFLSDLVELRILAELRVCHSPPDASKIDPNPFSAFPHQPTKAGQLVSVRIRIGDWYAWISRPIVSRGGD